MARRILDQLNDLLNFSVLILEILESIGLFTILAQELLQHLLTVYVDQTFLKGVGELVDDFNELGADAHDHVSYVALPASQVPLRLPILQNGLLSLFTDLVEALHRLDVALVDVLDIVFVDEAAEALESLLFGAVKVQATPMNCTAFAQSARGSVLSCLHHGLDDVDVGYT